MSGRGVRRRARSNHCIFYITCEGSGFRASFTAFVNSLITITGNVTTINCSRCRCFSRLRMFRGCFRETNKTVFSICLHQSNRFFAYWAGHSFFRRLSRNSFLPYCVHCNKHWAINYFLKRADGNAT
jgi:hypothetical protein